MSLVLSVCGCVFVSLILFAVRGVRFSPCVRAFYCILLQVDVAELLDELTINADEDPDQEDVGPAAAAAPPSLPQQMGFAMDATQMMLQQQQQQQFGTRGLCLAQV